MLKILANLSGDVVPSIRGLAKEAGFASAQSIQRHLDALEEVGYIERDEAPSRKRRPIRLTKQGWDAAGEMPFAGRIAAGRGLEALAVGESYSLTAGLLGSESGKSRYLLRVVGESMRDAGIHDGDLLVVEEDPSAGGWCDSGRSIGRRRRSYGKETAQGEWDTSGLRAQSAGHEDIVIAAEEVEIQGRVVWTLHPS